MNNNKCCWLEFDINDYVNCVAENMHLLLSSWMKLTPLGHLGLNQAVGEILKYRELCWNCWTSLMDLRLLKILRYAWLWKWSQIAHLCVAWWYCYSNKKKSHSLRNACTKGCNKYYYRKNVWPGVRQIPLQFILDMQLKISNSSAVPVLQYVTGPFS